MPGPDESPNPNKGRSSGDAKQAQAKAAEPVKPPKSMTADKSPKGGAAAGGGDAADAGNAVDAASAATGKAGAPTDAAGADTSTADTSTDSAAEGAAPEAATFATAIADDAAVPAAAAVGADVSAADVLSTVTAERDEYLEAMQRLKAEFANHKRRTTEQQTQQREQAAAGLVEKLLPVLDGCDAAMAHEPDAVRPISDALIDTLTKEGLARIEPEGDVFDPESHEAVMHEEGDGSGEPLVVEVLRAGYSWNGRILRPAMVKVKG